MGCYKSASDKLFNFFQLPFSLQNILVICFLENVLGIFLYLVQLKNVSQKKSFS